MSRRYSCVTCTEPIGSRWCTTEEVVVATGVQVKTRFMEKEIAEIWPDVDENGDGYVDQKEVLSMQRKSWIAIERATADTEYPFKISHLNIGRHRHAISFV